MKKQNHRQSNGKKSESPLLKDAAATRSRQVHPDVGEDDISPDRALDRIRARAYHLFELRGREPDHALDDWLQAEGEWLRLRSWIQESKQHP
jgi:hypothetical protein